MSSSEIATERQSDSRKSELSEPLDRLLEEALALCGTVDPALRAVLAGVLEGRPKSAVNIVAATGRDPTEALLTSFHMFAYACAEARHVGRETVDVHRLEMCAGCLEDRLKLAPPAGIDDSPRYS
jgi:hypothetical protein